LPRRDTFGLFSISFALLLLRDELPSYQHIATVSWYQRFSGCFI